MLLHVTLYVVTLHVFRKAEQRCASRHDELWLGPRVRTATTQSQTGLGMVSSRAGNGPLVNHSGGSTAATTWQYSSHVMAPRVAATTDRSHRIPLVGGYLTQHVQLSGTRHRNPGTCCALCICGASRVLVYQNRLGSCCLLGDQDLKQACYAQWQDMVWCGWASG